MTGEPDLFAELDAASIAMGERCYCGRDPDICEDSGGCPASREIARPGSVIARVRALHARSAKPVITHHPCSQHGARRGASGWTLPREEIGACAACTVTERYVCQHCRHACPDDDGWPCATIRALEGS